MQLGQVVGTATATIKHPTMQGTRLLLVQLLLSDGQRPDGEPVLAVDRLGAGRHDLVMVSTDGRAVRDELGNNTPVRYSVLGLCDT